MVWCCSRIGISQVYRSIPKSIWAVILTAQGKSSKDFPRELVTYWDWQTLSTPPILGGLNDQPAGLRSRAKFYDSIWQAIKVKQRYKTYREFFKKAPEGLKHTMNKVIIPARQKMIRERMNNAI